MPMSILEVPAARFHGRVRILWLGCGGSEIYIFVEVRIVNPAMSSIDFHQAAEGR
jgi:hypothetical protein